MNEYTLERQREVDDGRRAKVLLDSVEPYISEMESNLLVAFAQAPIESSPDTLVMIKLQLRAVQSLRQLIESVVATGDMAYQEIYGDLNDSYQQ